MVWYAFLGLGWIAVSELLLFSGVGFVCTFFTPMVWTGYIFFMDGLVLRRRGASLLHDHPVEFAAMFPLSIGFWLIFEFYNLTIQNWSYVGLPNDLWLRWLGYAWAFATIWPGILETAEWFEGSPFLSRLRSRPLEVKTPWLIVSLVFGIFCLAVPFLVSPRTAHFLAAPVWLGFIFLLEPINYWMGRGSLLLRMEEGDHRLLAGLLSAGFLCGFLWEFWNFWAGGKWHYTVPIMGDVKVFEMPVLGYLGFPPFAVECYTMMAFVKNIFGGRGRRNG